MSEDKKVKLEDIDMEIYEQLSRYSPEEVKQLLKQLKKPAVVERPVLKLGSRNAKALIISDTHIGNKCYLSEGLDLAARVAKNRKVDFVLHCGDICDGFYTNRPGHAFELTHIGADDQVNYAVKELSKFEMPLYFITGNHTRNTFFKNAGYEVGYALEDKIENATYLGNGNGTVQLESGVKIELLHPDGGSAYAISYKPQKWAESIAGGTKPDLAFIGHFHKAEYLFYRNIHIFQAGCLESQTPFMKGKGLAAHTGFWLVTLNTNKDGSIRRITPEFYPMY